MKIICNRVKSQYSKGTRVELIQMDDIQAPPVGTQGTVEYIDDLGDIHVRWDNGSGLALIPGEDDFRIV